MQTVGCGTGELARRVAPRVRQLDGLDVDDAVITTARRLTPDSLSIQYAQGDLLTADLRPGDGAITALAVLHHMPLEPALLRLRDLLAPGGTLVVLGASPEVTPTDHLTTPRLCRPTCYGRGHDTGSRCGEACRHDRPHGACQHEFRADPFSGNQDRAGGGHPASLVLALLAGLSRPLG